jgi:ATP-dependent Zn protease
MDGHQEQENTLNQLLVEMDGEVGVHHDDIILYYIHIYAYV